jgi:hypothetical protein
VCGGGGEQMILTATLSADSLLTTLSASAEAIPFGLALVILSKSCVEVVQ